MEGGSQREKKSNLAFGAHLGMQVTDCRAHLVEMQLGLGLIELGFLDDLVEQFSALGELQDDVEEVGRVDHVLEVDDAGVGGGAQDPHLVKDSEQSENW